MTTWIYRDERDIVIVAEGGERPEGALTPGELLAHLATERSLREAAEARAERLRAEVGRLERGKSRIHGAFIRASDEVHDYVVRLAAAEALLVEAEEAVSRLGHLTGCATLMGTPTDRLRGVRQHINHAVQMWGHDKARAQRAEESLASIATDYAEAHALVASGTGESLANGVRALQARAAEMERERDSLRAKVDAVFAYGHPEDDNDDAPVHISTAVEALVAHRQDERLAAEARERELRAAAEQALDVIERSIECGVVAYGAGMAEHALRAALTSPPSTTEPPPIFDPHVRSSLRKAMARMPGDGVSLTDDEVRAVVAFTNLRDGIPLDVVKASTAEPAPMTEPDDDSKPGLWAVRLRGGKYLADCDGVPWAYDDVEAAIARAASYGGDIVAYPYTRGEIARAKRFRDGTLIPQDLAEAAPSTTEPIPLSVGGSAPAVDGPSDSADTEVEARVSAPSTTRSEPIERAPPEMHHDTCRDHLCQGCEEVDRG